MESKSEAVQQRDAEIARLRRELAAAREAIAESVGPSAEVRYRHEREASLTLLRLLNDRNNTHELIRSLTDYLQQWTGCEAVGVRLREGDDFPYFETRGFPAEFVKAENYLCERDSSGEIRRDGVGSPVLECMCGNILCGRFDPALPFSTPKGSFWSNCTSDLLASTTEADRQARTRNRCNGEGYESVALIPLRHGDETLGLLQVNDRAKGRFTPEILAFLENAGDQIAMALVQRQAQAALRESEAKYRTLFESMRDAFATVDMKGRIQQYNKTFQQMLGYDPEELASLTYQDLTPSRWHEFEAGIIENQVFARGFSEIYEKEYRRKDGTLLPVELRTILFTDHTGQPLGMWAIIRDITERKRAEETLRQANQRLRIYERLVEGSPNIIMVVDREYVYRMANAASLQRRKKSAVEFIGHAVEEVVGKEAFQRIHPYGEQCFAGNVVHYADWFEYPDLGRRFMEIHYYPLPDENGQPELMVVEIHDATDRKQAEETQRQLEQQLQHAQKLESLGVLAGGIAHDFNNILAGIRGYADLVLRELPPATAAHGRVDEIRKATRRAADLTRQMLAYAGKGHFLVEPVNLSQAVEDLRDMLAMAVSKKAILRCELAPDLPAVDADAGQIRQVIMNLVVNASEALGDACGVVSISTSPLSVDVLSRIDSPSGGVLPEGLYVCLEVADTGCGMDEPTLKKVFDPFFTTKFAGRGLGLATVQGIVRAHGGAIQLSSQPGKGSTFRILLPAGSAGPMPV